MRRWWQGIVGAVVLAGAGLSGCQPLEAAPLPTPQAIRVQISTSLRPWTAELHACAQDLTGAGLVLEEIPASGLEPLQADLTLRLGDAPGEQTYAASLGEESVEVVVHPSNPVETLSKAELQGIFSGTIRNWQGIGGSPTSPGGQPIQVWTYPPGDDLLSAFTAAVLNRQALTPSASLAPNPGAVLEAVAKDPSAVGFVSRRWLDAAVKRVEVDPAGDFLRQPVLALLPKEPQGSTRQLLVCLQKSR